jgi:hypothetical protein
VATKGVNINELRKASQSVKVSLAPSLRKSLIIPMIYGLEASPYDTNIYRKIGLQIFENPTNKCMTNIWIEEAVERLVGMTIYYKR